MNDSHLFGFGFVGFFLKEVGSNKARSSHQGLYAVYVKKKKKPTILLQSIQHATEQAINKFKQDWDPITACMHKHMHQAVPWSRDTPA